MRSQSRGSGLWARILEKTTEALRSGALQPISTNFEYVEEAGVRFLARVLPQLDRKEALARPDKAVAGRQLNPFLPYDKRLLVGEITPSHVCLLNKFNVVDHHVLLVTRCFEEQESPLTRADFEAVWVCLDAYEGLAFYNAGEAAGASQRHKHLQYVPLPLAPEGPPVPTEPLLDAVPPWQKIGSAPGFPFVNAFTSLCRTGDKLQRTAESTLEIYLAMRRWLGLEKDAYNLLMTRQWMLLLPRSQECYQSISVNALGFAGSLLLRDRRELQMVKEQGPMRILTRVAIPQKARDRSPAGNRQSP